MASKDENKETKIVKNEEKKIEKKNAEKVEKKHTGLKVVLIFILCIGCFAGGYFGINFVLDKLNKNPKTKLELKSTDVYKKSETGITLTDVSDIVENSMPSIVSITSKKLIQSGYYGFIFGDTKSQYSEGAGSGIIISNNDKEVLVLTNNHVVSGSDELTVKFIDDTEADAVVKGTSERKDIAVISVKVDDLKKSTLDKIKIATLGDSDKLKVGNGVIAIGNALGYGQSVTTGVVSALNRELKADNYTNKMIQLDAAINGGNSGGALLNVNGEVVGINSAKYSSTALTSGASIEGMGFAIPISDVKDIIGDLMKGKTPAIGMKLGIEGYMTNSAALQGYKFPVGFYINGVTKGGYADKAGLTIGNIITEADGKKVEKSTDLTNILLDKKKGDSIKLKIKYVDKNEYAEKELEIKFDK